MHIPPKLEYARHMLTYKESLKELTQSLKDLEGQLDDNLQQMLVKSSSLVKLNKGIKEIELLCQALADINDDKSTKAKELLITLRRKLFENKSLLMEEIQKSMLKAAEAMIDASNGITIMASFISMSKILDKFEKG